jgi:nucleolar protein 4
LDEASEFWITLIFSAKGKEDMSDLEDEDTASDDDDDDDEYEDDEDSDDGQPRQEATIKIKKKVKADSRIGNLESERGHTKRIGKESNEGSDEGQEDDSVGSDAKSNESLSEDDENDTHAIDSAQERDLLKRVLNKVVVSGKDVLVNTTEVNNVDASYGQEKQQQQGEHKTVQKKKEAKPSKLPEQQTGKEMSTDIATADFKESAMRRTVFIRNLPVDVNVLDMRRRFSAFGEVKSFRPVLHPITK